ncbi:MAG TPA: lantibiotic dehydratase [Ktedonobacteraceae bacterium]|nr:lantibiotic dehydratase [Ktedonobacteraceae bacterium]
MHNEQNRAGFLASPLEQGEDRDQGQAASGLPGHVFSLDAEWALWRFVCLRGAGFPARKALALSAPDCASLVDQLLSAEEEYLRARAAALEALNTELLHATGERHTLLVQAFRAINKLRPPQPLTLTLAGNDRVDTLRGAYERLLHLQTELPAAFDAAMLANARVVQTLAGEEYFREAVLWQNRQALHTGLETLLRSTPEQTVHQAKRRNNGTLVANYIQRYALKNDSIGFFGPIGCATLASSGEAVSARPGTHLLEKRSVYFEGWCIEELAEALVRQNPQFLQWCAPRKMPHLYLDGTYLHLPFAPPVKLSRSQAAVFDACTGLHSARVIARALLKDAANGLQSEAQVYTILDQLCATKRIVWALEIPPEGNAPEQALRYWLEYIEDAALREEALAILERLERGRAEVARAAGDPVRLEEALSRLETEFSELTGKTATRAEGKTYAGRTLLYEDCRRALDVTFGPELAQTMREPLVLLLASARWYTYEIADLYEQAFRDAFLELSAEADSQTVDLADFWLWMQPFFYDDEQRLSDLILSEFQQHWSEIFALTDEQRKLHRLEYRASDLRERVLQRFSAPAPGWRAACYHSPDVLLDARNVEAIQRGDYQVVLGELHIAMNTLQITAFLAQHPAPEELLQAAALDIPTPRVLPILSKDMFPIYRLRPSLVTPKDFYLVYTPDVCSPVATPATALTLNSLVVEELDGRLIARTRDGLHSFELIEVFAEFLSRLVYGSFKMLPPSKHTPRITLDRVVVSREAWHFAPQELSFATEKTPQERFVATRRWARSQEMPRYIFVKVASEPKPCFVDFASPMYVEMFLKMVRQDLREDPEALSIAITEMLPAPDRLWLQDSAGEHYTSEVRFVAVDQMHG